MNGVLAGLADVERARLAVGDHLAGRARRRAGSRPSRAKSLPRPPGRTPSTAPGPRAARRRPRRAARRRRASTTTRRRRAAPTASSRGVLEVDACASTSALMPRRAARASTPGSARAARPPPAEGLTMQGDLACQAHRAALTAAPRPAQVAQGALEQELGQRRRRRAGAGSASRASARWWRRSGRSRRRGPRRARRRHRCRGGRRPRAPGRRPARSSAVRKSCGRACRPIARARPRRVSTAATTAPVPGHGPVGHRERRVARRRTTARRRRSTACTAPLSSA